MHPFHLNAGAPSSPAADAAVHTDSHTRVLAQLYTCNFMLAPRMLQEKVLLRPQSTRSFPLAHVVAPPLSCRCRSNPTQEAIPLSVSFPSFLILLLDLDCVCCRRGSYVCVREPFLRVSPSSLHADFFSYAHPLLCFFVLVVSPHSHVRE